MNPRKKKNRQTMSFAEYAQQCWDGRWHSYIWIGVPGAIQFYFDGKRVVA